MQHYHIQYQIQIRMYITRKQLARNLFIAMNEINENFSDNSEIRRMGYWEDQEWVVQEWEAPEWEALEWEDLEWEAQGWLIWEAHEWEDLMDQEWEVP